MAPKFPRRGSSTGPSWAGMTPSEVAEQIAAAMNDLAFVDLADVEITEPGDGWVVKWDASTGRWVAAAASGGFDGVHDDLEGRDAAAQHPAKSISIDADELNAAGNEWWSPIDIGKGELDHVAKHMAALWPGPVSDEKEISGGAVEHNTVRFHPELGWVPSGPPTTTALHEPIEMELVPGVIAEPSGDIDAWDYYQIREPSNVTFDPVTGQYIIAYTGRRNDGFSQIGAVLSTDLHVWEPHPQNPISSWDVEVLGEDPYFAVTKDGNLWRDSDGRALMYAEEKIGADHRGINLFHSAPDTLDDWTLYGRVIDKGESGSWDDLDRTSPTATVTDDGVVVVTFEGRNEAITAPNMAGGIIAEGRAVSYDEGLTFTVDPSPMIPQAGHGTGAWNAYGLCLEDVRYVDGVWIGWALGAIEDTGVQWRAGRVWTTDDPLDWGPGSWTEFVGNPVAAPDAGADHYAMFWYGDLTAGYTITHISQLMQTSVVQRGGCVDCVDDHAADPRDTLVWNGQRWVAPEARFDVDFPLQLNIGTEPLVEIGTDTSEWSWDSYQVREPGSALFDPVTGLWILPYSGRGLPIVGNTAYATSIGAVISADAGSWGPHPQNPITGPAIVDTWNTQAEDPYIVKDIATGNLWRDPDGRAHMFCEEKNFATHRGISHWRSGVNTLDDWEWVAQAVPEGEPDAWDASFRASPVVWHQDGVLWMLFEGANYPTNQGEVGIARSDDYGATWTVSPEPIIVRQPGWDRAGIVPDDIVRTDGRWTLLVHGGYTGANFWNVGRYFTESMDPEWWNPSSWRRAVGDPYSLLTETVQLTGNDIYNGTLTPRAMESILPFHVVQPPSSGGWDESRVAQLESEVGQLESDVGELESEMSAIVEVSEELAGDRWTKRSTGEPSGSGPTLMRSFDRTTVTSTVLDSSSLDPTQVPFDETSDMDGPDYNLVLDWGNPGEGPAGGDWLSSAAIELPATAPGELAVGVKLTFAFDTDPAAINFEPLVLSAATFMPDVTLDMWRSAEHEFYLLFDPIVVEEAELGVSGLFLVVPLHWGNTSLTPPTEVAVTGVTLLTRPANVTDSIDLLHQPRHEIVVPGGGAAAVTFDIDPLWRDIVIDWWCDVASGGSEAQLGVLVNGDTDAHYNWVSVGRYNGTNALSNTTGANAGVLADLSRDSNDNTRSSAGRISFPGDIATGRRHQIRCESSASRASSDSMSARLGAVEWTGTAAVTTITLFPTVSTFSTGRFTLSARKVAS